MFDGEKCIRCREYFRFEDLSAGPGGFSICDDCKAELGDDLEKSHLCLSDGTEMFKDVLSKVLIERCPACGSIWISGGELDRFLYESARNPNRAGSLGFLLSLLIPK